MKQKHIAEALGVSVMTVSRALRDHPDLSEQTKSKIVDAAKKMGYKRGPAGSGKKTAAKRAAVIAYGLHDGEEVIFSSDIPRAIFNSLQRACQDLNIETVIEFADRGQIPVCIKNKTVDMAFIFGRYSAEDIAQYPDDIPKLAVSSMITSDSLPHIVADNFRGMRMATEHLLSIGHKKIVYISMQDDYTEIFRDRADGYVSAMNRAGLPASVRYFQAFEHQAILESIRGMSGVVAGSDSTARKTIEALVSKGLSVPKDVSVVGFDNIRGVVPTSAKSQWLDITSYAPNWALMGQLAAHTLLLTPQDILSHSIAIKVPGKLNMGTTTQPIK